MPTNSTLLYLQSKVYAHIEAINKGKVSYQAGQGLLKRLC